MGKATEAIKGHFQKSRFQPFPYASNTFLTRRAPADGLSLKRPFSRLDRISRVSRVFTIASPDPIPTISPFPECPAAMAKNNPRRHPTTPKSPTPPAGVARANRGGESPVVKPAAPPSPDVTLELTTARPPVAAPSPTPRLRLKLFLIGLALGLLLLAVYSNSFSAGLVLDNGTVIGTDPRIKEVTRDNLFLIFHQNYWWPAFESDLYRPLTTLSYLFNYAILGDRRFPFGYHVVNFLLQWANVWLVLVIVRRLSGNLALAAIAAALFAVHPVNVESVTNIVGRGDLLATLSILLGGWCYLRAADASGWGKAAWLAGTGINALWGIFSKESAVLIAAFVFLYDLLWRWPRLPGKNFFHRLKQAALEFGLKGYVALLPALLFLWLVRSYLTLHSPVFGQVFADNPISQADSWFQGAMTAINVLGRYLLMMVFPRTLSCDYSYHQIPMYGEPGAGWPTLLSWVSLAVIVALIWVAVRFRRSQPLLSWGIAVFLIMQLPTCNRLRPLGSIMAERFLYLPSIGFCVAAALGLVRLGEFLARHIAALRREASAVGWVLAAATTVAQGARTHARNEDWQTDYSLWKSAVAAAPDSFKTHKAFALCLWDDALEKHRGDWTEEELALDAAIAESEKGLFILDHPPLSLPRQDNTLFQDLGMFYLLRGEILEHRSQADEARAAYQKSKDVLLRAVEVDHYANETSRETSLKRGRPEAEIADVGNQHIYVLLVQACEHLQDWSNAEKYARYIQQLMPLDSTGYRFTAVELAHQGRIAEAIIQTLEAILMDPTDPTLYQNLSLLYQGTNIVPNPVTPSGKTFALNSDIPLVRAELNEAGVALIRHLQNCKQFEAAAVLREKFIKNYLIPAELFDQK